jgi:hypothetical protein
LSPLEAVIRRALSDLARARVKVAIIGGHAVSARTEFRFTRDVDVALSVTDDRDAERVVSMFLAAGYQVLSILDQTATGRFATVRLLPPGEPESGAILDLLFASSGIEPEVVAAADSVELYRGLYAPVATIGHLIALKVLSRSDSRPNDTADLHALIGEASDEDLVMARAALDLIAERGYDRGKDLQGDFAELLARFCPGG